MRYSRQNKIIEIGAVLMKDGQELDRFQTFADPGRKLDKKIVELTGITDEMLYGAPKIEEVLPKFLEFVGDRVLVVLGKTAAKYCMEAPIDAAIVAILDENKGKEGA